MTVKIVSESHVDHGLTPAQLKWVLDQFSDRTGFFVASVDLPASLGTVPCGLHGPIMGDEAVADSEVFMAVRGKRQNPSRMCRRAARQVSTVTVIAGPHGDESCVLYTAFGGPLAEREPGDPGLKSDEDKAKSAAFWATHALSHEG